MQCRLPLYSAFSLTAAYHISYDVTALEQRRCTLVKLQCLLMLLAVAICNDYVSTYIRQYALQRVSSACLL
jgi:hypothetical protein